MAYIKNSEETKVIAEGGKILGQILQTISKMARPGVSAAEIDAEAERLIKKAGGVPAFKGYKNKKSDPPFPSTICFSANEELVHGIASPDKIIQKGDIVSLDIGMRYPAEDGYFTDTALTVPVGSIPKDVRQLLTVTKKSLELGIKQCVAGNTIADIGRAVQDYAESFGYGVVRDLVGHGVGHAVHEDPRVPNYYDEDLEDWVLEPGVVIAVEPMITMGDYQVGVADDGWSISTLDKSMCAHFEHTIIITDGKPIVATRRSQE